MTVMYVLLALAAIGGWTVAILAGRRAQSARLVIQQSADEVLRVRSNASRWRDELIDVTAERDDLRRLLETTEDRAIVRRIPVYAWDAEVTDEAMRHAGIDLLSGTARRLQARFPEHLAGRGLVLRSDVDLTIDSPDHQRGTHRVTVRGFASPLLPAPSAVPDALPHRIDYDVYPLPASETPEDPTS